MDNFEINHLENEELVEEINLTNAQLCELTDEKKLSFYPMAFFRIFVKFQKFIYKMFEQYCLNNQSSANYKPLLKHTFSDEKELCAFLGTKNKNYIDYDGRIKVLMDYIFEDNPFANLFFLSPLTYDNLIIVRNYIAHESKSSLNSLSMIIKQKTLSNYLLEHKNGTTNYEKIVTALKLFSDFIIEGQSQTTNY